jgi:predicted NUDIX family phosphoesterase
MTTNKLDEIIVVVPRTKVFENELFTFQGVEKNDYMIEKIVGNMAKHFTTMRRGDAEENFNFKQPIPYVVLRKGNLIYTYERLKGGGESRLHNKLSVGIGGHVNLIEDATFEAILHENMLRELEEELEIIASEMEFTTIGLINDDENDVGKVHIGLLVVLDIDEDGEVNVRETDQLKGSWMSLGELLSPNTYERLEPWSKFTVDILT